MKTKVTAKVRKDLSHDSERVIEFIVVGDNVKGGSQGGLISIRIAKDGGVIIDPYRCDYGVVTWPVT